MNSRFKLFYPLIVILLLALNCYGEGSKKSFFWKVHSKKATVYIMGSIHVAKKGIYPLNPKFVKAFKESKVLVVEVDITKINTSDAMKLMQSFFYKGEDVLDNHISKKTYEKAKTRLSTHGIPIVRLNKFKPWMIGATITLLDAAKLGYDKKYGIDLHFLNMANKNKKTILALETAKEQMSILDNLSDTVQEEFLVSSLGSKDDLKKDMEEIFKTWKEGDLKAFRKAFISNFKKHPKLAPLYEKLIIDRNITMTSRIEAYIKKGGTYFVIVGSGHLTGKEGIIELLKAKGYSAKQL